MLGILNGHFKCSDNKLSMLKVSWIVFQLIFQLFLVVIFGIMTHGR